MTGAALTLPALMTEQEVADYLGRSKATIRRWRHGVGLADGQRLRYVKRGRMIRYPVADVIAFVAPD